MPVFNIADYLGIPAETPQQPMFQQTRNIVANPWARDFEIAQQADALKARRPFARLQAIQSGYDAIQQKADDLRRQQEAEAQAEQAVSALTTLTPGAPEYLGQRAKIGQQFPMAVLDPRVNRLMDDSDRLHNQELARLGQKNDAEIKSQENLNSLRRMGASEEQIGVVENSPEGQARLEYILKQKPVNDEARLDKMHKANMDALEFAMRNGAPPEKLNILSNNAKQTGTALGALRGQDYVHPFDEFTDEYGGGGGISASSTGARRGLPGEYGIAEKKLELAKGELEEAKAAYEDDSSIQNKALVDEARNKLAAARVEAMNALNSAGKSKTIPANIVPYAHGTRFTQRELQAQRALRQKPAVAKTEGAPSGEVLMGDEAAGTPTASAPFQADTNYQKELEKYLPKNEADINKADFSQLSEWARNPRLNEALHAKVIDKIANLPAAKFKDMSLSEIREARESAIKAGAETAKNRNDLMAAEKYANEFNAAWDAEKSDMERDINDFVKKNPEFSADAIYREIAGSHWSDPFMQKEGSTIIPFILGDYANEPVVFPKKPAKLLEIGKHFDNLLVNKTKADVLAELAREKVAKAPKQLPAAAPSGSVAPKTVKTSSGNTATLKSTK